MEKINKMFKTPKSTVISLLVIGLILIVLGTGSVFATTSIVESVSIGKENAQNFAFVDADVDPTQVQMVKNKFEFEHGKFVYDVEFMVEGTKYEYLIKASDGSIIKKEVDASNSIVSQKNKEPQNVQTTTQVNENQPMESGESYNTEQNAQETNITNPPATNQNTQETNIGNTPSTSQGNQYTQNTGTISLETAKSKALSNAGVSSESATFTKTELDRDDGILVYDIEFYTSTHKYEYEINATTGVVNKRESKMLETAKNSGNNYNNNNNNNNTYIGVDKAKSIALNHAGVSSSAVTFKKAQLDRDDGIMIYEIEFYKGAMEYEYEINAITGQIIKYDID